MIATQDQVALSAWLCSRIGLAPAPTLRCIGNMVGGHLKGVVGYDGYNGASLMMHSAGEGNWLTREFLWAAFDYPFNVCKVNMVLGMVPSGNRQAIKFNTHLGFRVRDVLFGAHPDGALWIMSMDRRECRFLHRRSHGQEISTAAAT